MLTRCLAFTFKELEKSALAHMVVTTATATTTTVFGLTRRYSFYWRRNDPFALLRHAGIWVGRVVCGTMSEEHDLRRNGPCQQEPSGSTDRGECSVAKPLRSSPCVETLDHGRTRHARGHGNRYVERPKNGDGVTTCGNGCPMPDFVYEGSTSHQLDFRSWAERRRHAAVNAFAGSVAPWE